MRKRRIWVVVLCLIPLAIWSVHIMTIDRNSIEVLDLQKSAETEERTVFWDIYSQAMKDWETQSVIFSKEDENIQGVVIYDDKAIYMNDNGEIYQRYYGQQKVEMLYDTTINNAYLLYGDTEEIYIFDGEKIYIWKLENNKIVETIGGFTEFVNQEVGYTRCLKKGDVLLVLGQKYNNFTSIPTSTAIPTIGKLKDYQGAVISFIDLTEKKVLDEYVINDEVVIYFDENQYATMSRGKICFYQYGEEQAIREENIQDYEKGTEGISFTYYLATPKNTIQIYKESELIQSIAVIEK